MTAPPSCALRAPFARALAVALLAAWTLAPARATAQATNDSLVTLAQGCAAEGVVERVVAGMARPDGSARADSVARADSLVRPSVVRPMASPSAGSAAHPALVLRAAVSAREIRFTGQPRVVVRLCGAVGDSVRVLERRNLPSPVVAGTTYRDVYVAVEILGHLDGQCLAARLTGVRPDSLADARRCASLATRSSDR
jgi:hypothetical protein